MKKIMIAASTLLLLITGACSEKNAGANGHDEKQVYTGILPAADADGIRYTLTLDYDEDDKDMKGDYDLVETYLVTDSVSPLGMKDLKSFRSEGDFYVENKDGKTYLRFAPDAKDSDRMADTSMKYFLVESDSTLVLVNNDLQPASDSGLNYTLKRTN